MVDMSTCNVDLVDQHCGYIIRSGHRGVGLAAPPPFLSNETLTIESEIFCYPKNI